jgi:hypothetical protein
VKVSEALRMGATLLRVHAEYGEYIGVCTALSRASPSDHFAWFDASRFFRHIYKEDGWRDSPDLSAWWMGPRNQEGAWRRLIALDLAACFAEELEAAGLPVTLP